MQDTTQQEENTPVSETQEAPIPSADQKTTDSEQSEQVADESQVPSQGAAEPVLETDNARTAKEFDKLRSQLREERLRREYAEAVYQSSRPKQEATPVAPIYDPDTGLLNEQALNDVQRTATQAQQEAQAAKEALAQFQLEQQERALYEVYPELDSDEKHGKAFDKDFFLEARRISFDSAVNPQDYGGQLDIKQAADLVKGRSAKEVAAAKKEGAQQALEQLTPKEQASLQATGAVGTTSAGNLDDLQRRSRKGDLDAIVARLQNVGE